MNKVIIIGCPGSGKSVLARKLNLITGIPLFHLDNLYWNADKTTVPKEEFLFRLHRAMSSERWIIDGNYASTMEMRMRACDTVIFLDYPTEICVKGIRERCGRPRSDMPWYETEGGLDAEFVSFAENYRTDSRPHVLELLDKYREKNVIILRDRDEADRFIGGITNRTDE